MKAVVRRVLAARSGLGASTSDELLGTAEIRTPAFRRSARARAIVRPVAATSVPAGGVRRVLPRDCASQGRRPHGPRPTRSCLCSPWRPPDGEPLLRLVHSTSPAPAAPRARVAGGAEEPLLARHIRSSKRRPQDAYATPRRRRTRARSRRLSLRLRERLCSPARTPRCRSSSRAALVRVTTGCPERRRSLRRILWTSVSQ